MSPLINTASKVYKGNTLATKVYRGAAQVWPSGPAFVTLPPDPTTHRGVFYHLGTNGGVSAWSNPHTSGKAVVTQSTDQGGGSTPGALLDRANSLVSQVAHTQNVSDSWMAVTLTGGPTLRLTGMSIAVRGDYNGYFFGATPGTVLRVEGSVDGVTWTQLAYIPNTSIIKTQGAWSELSITPAGFFVRFRVNHLGQNSNGTYHFVVGELEFYGDLTP